jgi:hypothetical protein
MDAIFEHDYALPEGLSPRLAIVMRQIEFARNYTMTLLEDLTDDDWFWSPPEYPTHIAWQVGHIAMSEYGLTMFQQRGRQSADMQLMSGKFRKLFLRGTQPKLDRSAYPSPSEILEVLDGIHLQMRIEVPTFEDNLDEEIGPPHAAYATKYGALLFAPQHEMLHAGQIGVLRRLMGKPSIR